MTYPQQGQPMTYPSQPAPARTGGKRPRGWHVAAALTLGLFVLWFIVSLAASTCPPAKPTYSGSSSSGSSSSSVACKPDDAICKLRVRWQEEDLPTTPAKKKPSPICEASGGIDSILMLGQLVGIIVTIVMVWKRRRTYSAYRKSVFAVDDYERRVPPGSEQYVDLATHQMAAQAAANASTEMWMNQAYWFAPSGPETQARIDAIRETGARAQAAAQQIEMSQYAPMEDGMDDLEAPDLGGGDTTSDTPTDAADDWMSGLDNNDNDW